MRQDLHLKYFCINCRRVQRDNGVLILKTPLDIRVGVRPVAVVLCLLDRSVGCTFKGRHCSLFRRVDGRQCALRNCAVSGGQCKFCAIATRKDSVDVVVLLRKVENLRSCFGKEIGSSCVFLREGWWSTKVRRSRPGYIDTTLHFFGLAYNSLKLAQISNSLFWIQ